MPGGKTNRTRGFGLEREIVNAAKAEGLTAKRMWGSDGRTAGLPAEVDVVIEGRWYQCKRKRKLPAYLITPDTIATIVRQDHDEARVFIPLAHYLDLLACAKKQSDGEAKSP